MNVCICLFIIPSEVIFSKPGNHSNDGRDTQELLLFHLKIVLNTQKNLYLNQATQKIQFSSNFPIPKNLGIKNFKPKKYFDYLYQLKSQIPNPHPYPHRIKLIHTMQRRSKMTVMRSGKPLRAHHLILDYILRAK